MENCPLFTHEALQAVTGSTIRPGGIALTERALSHCVLSRTAAILDIGCGRGATVAYLRKNGYAQAYGIDANPVMPEGRYTFPGGGQAIPFQGGAFETVLCECVLSLVEDCRAVLAECRRVLKHLGFLIVSDVYRRKETGAFTLGTLPLHSCLTGARTRKTIEEEIEGMGFRLIRWEDHSRLLAELSARIILEYGSLEAFWNTVGPGSAGALIDRNVRTASLGYYLLIAQKVLQ